MTFNSEANLINMAVPTLINTLSIGTTFQLLNDIPIIVANNFKIQNTISLFAIFNADGFYSYRNLIFSTSIYPKIIYNTNQILTITDTTETIMLKFSDTITIEGPNNNFVDISNCIVNSSFSITNTSAIDYNLTFTPKTKLYILSTVTRPNAIFIFTCNNILNINNMSGKIMGTTWALNTFAVNAYDINIWSFPYNNDNQLEFNIGYSTLLPVNITNRGDWYIDSIYLTQPNFDGIYNLNIKVIGSTLDKIVWGLKVDILQI